MAMPLPNLDDRRWADLVEEGRSLIPVYGPGWTDHNLSDPGMTFLDLLAWVTEMDVFQADQVPERHRLKFLGLVGVEPRPPAAAQTVLHFKLAQTSPSPLRLPMGTELAADDPFGVETRFRIRRGLSVIAAGIEAVKVTSRNRAYDVTERRSRGEPVPAFGDDPVPGDSLELRFGAPLPANVEISLWFGANPDVAEDLAERARLVEAARPQAAACGPAGAPRTCSASGRETTAALTTSWPCPGIVLDSPVDQARGAGEAQGMAAMLQHHSVRTEWEVGTLEGEWLPLDKAAGEVVDETRSFSLNGAVRVHLAIGTTGPAGARSLDYHRLRCRFVAGAYDTAPRLFTVAVNAVAAEQAVLVTPTRARTNRRSGRVYETLGGGSGWPEQRVALKSAPIVASSLRLYTIEAGRWLRWWPRPDFDASGRVDRHFVLDAATGEVRFGDGACGRVVPQGVAIVARFRETRAEAGNLDAGKVMRLADSARNRALLGRSFATVKDQFTRATPAIPNTGGAATNAIDAAGGAAAETLADAEARANASVERVERAVTLADYQALALDAPGSRVARAWARANMHPAFPCLHAPGVVTLVVLPFLPAGRPMPSPGLRRAITAHVGSRRVIGTRVEVVGPTYMELAVRAKVQARPGASVAGLQQRVIDALNGFFHPLTGGPDGQGWPFGRDVYRSEVLQVIDETPGVDHVLALELLAGGCDPQCGNVCVGVLGLVAAGSHQIEVTGGTKAC